MPDATNRERRSYVKAFSDVMKIPGLKFADVGYYWALLEESRGENSDGFVTNRQTKIVALTHGYYSEKSSLKRLCDAGLVTEIEGGYQLDWNGQTTATARSAKREKNASDQRAKRERQAAREALHTEGDHSKCYRPYCESATKWARGKKPTEGARQIGTSEPDFLKVRSKEVSLTGKPSESSIQVEGGRRAPLRPAAPGGALPSVAAPPQPQVIRIGRNGVLDDENNR